MKKKLILSISFVAIAVATISFVKAGASVDDATAMTPCRMHIDQCPAGYSGGYHCSKGIPTLPACIPSECGTITPCSPSGGQ